MSKIHIDKNKMLSVKNQLDEINTEIDFKIKKDCETLISAFNDVINNTLPSHKLKSSDLIKSREFPLNRISSFLFFNKYCGHNVNDIQDELSKAIGVNTTITLKDYSYPPNLTYKLHLKLSIPI